MNRRWILSGLAGVILVLAVAPGLTASAPRNNSLVFAMNLPVSLLGEGASTIINYLDVLRKDVRQKTKWDVDVRMPGTWDDVMKGLSDGSVDVAWMPAIQYARARVKKLPIEPLVTYSSRGKTASVVCLYVSQETGLRTMDQMVGTVIAVPDESSWILLHHILRDEKNPISPQKFFDDVRVMSRESAAWALVFDKIQGVVMDAVTVEYIRSKNARLRDLVPVACTKTRYPNTLLVKRKNLPADKTKTLKGMLLGMHRDPAFRNLWFWFEVSGGRWVSADVKDYDAWVRLYSEGVAAGWLKEYQSLELD